ncbi:DUF2586 family protein [Sorangium sp. So ce542]|uniref:DUF2586 family protein n=1 Tax=Sorangium sp. So ce542 TaxID=3133316 RepID=UPI003F5EA27C
MSTPSIEIEVLDNQLGIRAPADAVLAIVATAAGGPLYTPTPTTRTKDLIDTFIGGPLVEAGAYAIERFGLTVLPVRTDASVAGGFGPLVQDLGGTSVATIDATVEPTDELEVTIRFLSGGTVGTDGITYQYSLDGGRTPSTPRALGTATSIVLSEAGNVRVNLGAGTIGARGQLSFPTTAPRWNAGELAEGITALRHTRARWTALEVYGDLDAMALSALDAGLEAMHAAGRNRRAIAHARKPSAGETPAAYLAALSAAFRGVGIAARGRVRRVREDRLVRVATPLPQAAVARCRSARRLGLEEIDLAELAYGPLPGVFIRDANGNPDEHDETVFPGLDDARFLTLRSWEIRAGVWVNNPRLFSPVGSDFLYLQYGRVIDLACDIARAELEPILSRGVEVLRDGSGRIDPEVATSIEGQLNARLGDAIVAKRKGTSVVFTLSRLDDVLRTGAIGWQVRVLPLAYIKKMRGTVALVASASATANVRG